MEFPEVGDNCSHPNCKMLDFLPVQCSACRRLFCKDHYLYSQHNCTEAYRADNQIPVCPLCGVLVPVKPGETPDVRVGEHIDTACQSQPARELKGKIFTNACSMPKCRKKELVPFRCPQCHGNFCLTHRNELDHVCQGKAGGASRTGRLSLVGAAAVRRAAAATSAGGGWSGGRQYSPVTTSGRTTTQANEASARRLQEEEDRQLALALAASLREADVDQQRRQQQQARARQTPQQQQQAQDRNGNCSVQ